MKKIKNICAGIDVTRFNVPKISLKTFTVRNFALKKISTIETFFLQKTPKTDKLCSPNQTHIVHGVSIYPPPDPKNEPERYN